MPISIKDIAKKANVSPSTVSRALNDHPRISTETKKQIKELAKSMGYVPSQAARNLVTQQSATIGVAVADYLDPFYVSLLASSLISTRRSSDLNKSEVRILRRLSMPGRSMTPGPYTFVFEATREVPKRLQNPKRRTIGLRVPDHPIVHAMLEALVSSTSAFGRPSCRRARTCLSPIDHCRPT